MKLTIIITINYFVIIVNFRNRFDKALTEIFQFCMALIGFKVINAGIDNSDEKMYLNSAKISLCWIIGF